MPPLTSTRFSALRTGSRTSRCTIREERCPRISISIDHAFSSQDLALEARDIWLEWNRAIKESHPSDLPEPLTPEDELLKLCGVYHLADGPDMIGRYVENLRVMGETAPSFRDLQLVKVRQSEIARNLLYILVLTLVIGQF